MSAWKEKANRVIASLCLDAYRKANYGRNGLKRKKHHPYRVPDDAQILVECLKCDDEETAKSLFVRQAVLGLNTL